MVRRVTPSQLQSMIRQAQREQQQAIRNYNSAVNNYNREVHRVVDNYNREVRAHNSRARTNQARLQSELRRLNSLPAASARYVTATRTVRTVEHRFSTVESLVQTGRWSDENNLFDLIEGETADSVSTLNRLLDPPSAGPVDDAQATSLTTELAEISPELQDRWTGALFALNPRNPDAARHFCTSARELLTAILDIEAPDAEVIVANAEYFKTPNGGVSRRAKVHYLLDRSGNATTELVDFVEADIDGVISLFSDFNQGTHGEAGRFPIAELVALKERVERAVKFVHRLALG